MEYTSPGWKWSSCMLLASVAVVANVILCTDARRQHRRQNNHFMDSYKNDDFSDFDYEESTVMLRPEFMNSQSNVTVMAGSMATLPCVVRYLGTKKVAWKRVGDDHFLTVGTFTWLRGENIQVDRKQEEGQISHWNLVIKSVDKSDEGTYECQVTDKHPIKTHITLLVRPRPAAKPTVKMTGEAFIDRNDPIELLCNATGGPIIPEDIDWFKDGSKIFSSVPKYSHILMTKYRSLEHHALISKLYIDKAEMRDSGTYVCRSSDRKIDSLKVTVLVADTTNVKRRSGGHHGTEDNSTDQRDNNLAASLCGSATTTAAIVFVFSALISCLLS